jgi:PPP family 3-phenylpropionic acid transporter
MHEECQECRQHNDIIPQMNNPPPPPDPRRLVVVKALYFLYFAAVGGFFYYLFIYYNQIGLTSTQIGILSSLGPLIGILAGPLWGWVSDRLSITRPLFIFATAAGMAFIYILSTTVQFGWIMVLTILGSFFTTPLMTLLDSTTLLLLGERRDLYGQQRLWGSAGYILTSYFFGQFLQVYGMHWIFPGYIAIMGLYLLVSFGLPMRRLKVAAASSAIDKGIFQLLKQRTWTLFSISMIVMAVAMNSIIVFLAVYMVRLGSSPGLVGTVGALGALVEIPFMYAGSWLIRRFGSRTILLLGYAGYFLRLVVYAIMRVPDWALFGSATNGISYSFMQTASVAFVDEITPAHLKGTSMGLYNATFSLGGMINGVLNGALLDSIGGGMYTVNAGLLLVAMLLLLFTSSKAGRPGAGQIEEKPLIAG